MHLQGIRLWRVVAVCLLTLVLLLGGRWLYNKQYLQENMIQELLAIPGVESVQVTETGEPRIITLGLGRVQDLQAVYREIGQRLSGYDDLSVFRVEISGRPDTVLEDVWARTQLAVYQSLFQGNYTAISEAVASEAEQAGLTDFGVQMDWNYAYVTMQHGDHYLYRVIPRERAEGSRTVSSATGGGNGGV